MTTRTQVLVPIIIAAVIVGVVGLSTLPGDAKRASSEFPIGTIKIDDVVLQVQIADTEARRAGGLMFQDQLPYDEGMIFVFDQPGNYGLWMRNMQFALDMIWFDADGRVVDIIQGVPPCITVEEIISCDTYQPEGKASYILEVTSGFVEKYDITRDSILTVISI
ncbi:MAG: DUF192 domain-containing protein [Nitrosopumilus sp. H8]|nr:MAG: DUF192 domain-containing protein [Nitrosopumilus sp. H13]RNJ79137.1 MAG: DUF192 domain-containing protein [Nitrosopumilus sp. H8]